MTLPGGKAAPFELRLGGGPVPVLVSIVRAEFGDGLAHVEWRLQGSEGEYLVQRAELESLWDDLRAQAPDGLGSISIDDRGLTSGGRYGYRRKGTGGAVNSLGEVWLDSPRFVFGLEGAWPTGWLHA